MLSSLRNQVGVQIYTQVAITENECGDKPSVEIVDFFKKNQTMDIQFGWTWIFDIDTFTNRGLTRTKQLQELKDFDSYDYFLFGDCDHIYEHDFFFQMVEAAAKHGDRRTMYSVCRYSTKNVSNVNNLIFQDKNYPRIIDKPVTQYKRALKRSEIYKTTNPGAGNCQLVARDTIKDKIYVDRKKDGGILVGSSKFPSDKQFRRRIGQHTKLAIESKQYHLQHERVDADKISIDTQR
jgi:hypothetical protein